MRTTYYVASTIDGFIADVDGGIDYLSEIGDPDPQSYESFISTVDGMLMGRNTYDQVLGFGRWPYSNLPCWIATNRELHGGEGKFSKIQGDPIAMLSTIEEAGVNHLWLVGGGELATALLRANLIDCMIVSVIPAVLGEGIRIFEGLDETRWFSHEQTEMRSGGVVEIHFFKRPEKS